MKVTLLLLSLFSVELFSQQYPALPEPVSNNAVAKITTQKGQYLLSFMGLGAKKNYQAIHNKVWALKLGEDHWQEKQPVPSSIQPIGRLASTAVGVGAYAYIFGGYNVNAKHQEVSSPDVFRYELEHDRYIKLTPMPVPVDDSVALVYQQRYIYLVSGWHNDGNVNLVQVYDIKENTWQQASPFLGQAVFGQAGAIVKNIILVCDGVMVVPHLNKRRTYRSAEQCRKGVIDLNNPSKVAWSIIRHPTGVARYRMAASALANKIIFIGGSTNPYNYNGIGYDGVPSSASDAIWIFDTKDDTWQVTTSKHRSMDHRGLLNNNNELLTIGGMNNQQQVISNIYSHDLP